MKTEILMEPDLAHKPERRRRKRKATKGKNRHWAVWLIFGIVLGVLICEVAATIGAVLLP